MDLPRPESGLSPRENEAPAPTCFMESTVILILCGVQRLRHNVCESKKQPAGAPLRGIGAIRFGWRVRQDIAPCELTGQRTPCLN